jgi:hypothetical protein
MEANEYTQNLYKQLLRTSRQWRDLKTRMEQGLGHQPEETTLDGSMAIFCPACPQPGINLPDDWKTRYELYAISPDSCVFTIHISAGTNSSGHLSWMGISLQST